MLSALLSADDDKIWWLSFVESCGSGLCVPGSLLQQVAIVRRTAWREPVVFFFVPEVLPVMAAVGRSHL